MKSMKIAPSILSSDFSMLKEELVRLSKAKVDYIHFDVMDNHFVPNLTFGSKFIKDMRRYTDLPFDTHFMIEDAYKTLDSFISSGCDIYTYHIEAVSDANALYKRVSGCGKKFGLSVKPKTPIESVYPYLRLVDMVLVMLVEPGFGGQKLIEEALPKISELKNELIKRGYDDVEIEVDGGITLENIGKVASFGANVFVMGSAFFKSKDYKQFVEAAHDKLSRHKV